MEMYKKQFSITAMCRVLGVSRSGYYAWVKRPPSQRSLEDELLGKEIEQLHSESKQTYGSPRIHAELRSNGIRCGRKRVVRLMRDRDLKPKQAKKFKVTTDSRHKLPVAENLLARKFEPEDRNQAWAADITYSVPGVHESSDALMNHESI
jgi:transposase InsO family protein